MTALATVVLPPPKLVHDELLAEPILDNLTGHLGTLNQGLANLDGIVRRKKKYLVELDPVPEVTLELLNHHRVAGLYPILLATSLNHCVHRHCSAKLALGIAEFRRALRFVKTFLHQPDPARGNPETDGRPTPPRRDPQAGRTRNPAPLPRLD